MSSKERFERLEATLERIETKIDTKPGMDTVDRLERRIVPLESGDSPLGRILMEQFVEMQHQVSDLQLHGSRHAQDLQKYFERMTGRVDELEKSRNRELGAQNERMDRHDRATRFWEVVAATAILLSAIATILTLVHP